jgi:hypothetical protein
MIKLTKIEGFHPRKKFGDLPPHYEQKKGVFSKGVLVLRNFRYDF